MTDFFLEMMDNLQRQMDFLKASYVQSQQEIPSVELQVGELMKHPESLKKTLGEILYANGAMSDAAFEKFKAELQAMPEHQDGATKYGAPNWDQKLEPPLGPATMGTPKPSTDWSSAFLTGVKFDVPPTVSEKEAAAVATKDLKEFFVMFHNALKQVDQVAAVINNHPTPRERTLISLFGCLAVRCSESKFLSALYNR